MTQKLLKLEAALMAGLAVAVILCAASGEAQGMIADKLIRLHVIANSDSAEDQALKHRVRDRILSGIERLTTHAENAAEAAEIIKSALPSIEGAAREEIFAAGYDYAVTASVEDSFFPTKAYPGFSLPAGQYSALRLVIGDGAGENWWCVLFPPLCTSAQLCDTAAAAGFSRDEIKLLTSDGQYEIRFKLIEFFERLRHKLGIS